MKMIKKLIFIVTVSLLCVFAIPTKAANKDSAKDPTGVSTYTPVKSTSKDIYGMNHTLAEAKTSTNGNNKGQLINVFEMKTDGVTSKLVTWAVQNDNSSYKRTNIIQAAKDYEEKHPGWIVTGGINADQYFFKFGDDLAADGSTIFQPSPYYPMITDGEKRYTVTPYNNSSNIVGFTNDGSKNSFAYPDGTIGGYQLTIIDEFGKELNSFVVDNVNKHASSNQTTVWCAPVSTSYSNKTQDKNIKTTNQLYVIENADLAYVSIDESYGYPSGAPTSLFCKGTISNSTLKEFTVSKGQFAIETTNQNVISALSNGTKVKVELLFGSETFNQVDEGMGYHSIHMLNGVVQTGSANAQYNTQSYSRALMGKKADGTYVLITADYVTSLGSQGLNFTECNAVANYYDCTDLFQMDGGGSVTALARLDDGSFKVTNYPKDSGNPNNPRENLSYLFFVKRDPGVIQNQELTTHYSVTFDKKELLGNIKIENLKLSINNKQYEFGANNQLTVDGLNQDTAYKVRLTYNIVDGNNTIPDYVDIYAKTRVYEFPTDIINITDITDTSIKVIKTDKDYADNISNIVLHIGHTTFNMGNNNEYICTNLSKDFEYEVYCTYDIYDPSSKQTFSGKTEEITIKTKAFKIPSIVKLEETRKSDSSLGVSYEYQDDDRVITRAYISVNGEVGKEIAVKSGTITLTNLNFKENEYTVKLVIEYLNEEGKTIVLESNALEYLHETETPEPIKKKCGKKGAELIIATFAATSVIGVFFRKRK
mgnify:CR=1 FL=1